MTGGTYGTTTGGTYGTSDGLTYGGPLDGWRIDGQSTGTLIDERATWQSLTLTFWCAAAIRDQVFVPVDENAEELSVITATDGSFAALDRSESGTANTYTLTPPSARDPLRTEGTYHAAGYRERAIDQDIATYEITTTWTRAANREPQGTTHDETRASDEWSFAFREATIATGRVAAAVEQAVDTAVSGLELSLVLDNDQAAALEQSVSRLAATSTREVPDGPNRVDDNSPPDANTIAITPPDGTDRIPSGEYVVSEWTCRRLTDTANRVTMAVSRPPQHGGTYGGVSGLTYGGDDGGTYES